MNNIFEADDNLEILTVTVPQVTYEIMVRALQQYAEGIASPRLAMQVLTLLEGEHANIPGLRNCQGNVHRPN